MEHSRPKILDTERLTLANDLEKHLMFALPKDPGKTPTLLHLFIGNQRKLLDLRFKKAINEIKSTSIEKGKIRIWSFMNMGVVVKTANHTIAFDVSDMSLSTVQKGLASVSDILFITHSDADHYDPTLLKKALDGNKHVVLPDKFGFLYGDNYPNLHKVKYEEEFEIDGVTITAFQTDHRGDGNYFEPAAWYLIKTDGFTLLHTGDGMNFKDVSAKEGLSKYNVDIFLANVKTHPLNIRDIKPKVVVPLHLYKFLHSKEELQKSTFSFVINTFNPYEKELQGIDTILLFPGESFEYNHTK